MKQILLLSTALLLASPAAIPEKAGSSCTCEMNAKSFSRPFTTVAKKATPASVFIRVEINPSSYDQFGQQQDPFGGQQSPFGDDFLNRFFGFPPGGRPLQPQPQVGQGSGFLVSADGYIMTNNHVVQGADKIEVTLNDGQVRQATLVGTDPRTDLAIIKVEKIDNQDFPFLELGDSENLEVGEWVIAVGNPFQLQASVTAGAVSAKGRQGLKITDYEDFIQTDAAINPGN